MSLIKKLFYKVGEFELDIPNWNFSDEGVTALTGSVGSGKTTILKILCGLIDCPSLYWELKGVRLSALSPPKRNLGVCFQDLHLFPHLTAKENILFVLQARKISFLKIKQDFEDIVEILELKKILNLFIEDLSGGEKQRLAIARALIAKPRFLFLDEPFSSLDEKSHTKALYLTSQLIKKYSVPALLISHDRRDVESLAKEEFFLKNGKIFKKK